MILTTLTPSTLILAAAAPESLFTPTFLWLLAGAVLCLVEMLTPTAFITFMMGIAAFLVALVSLILPQLSVQVVLWLVFSTLLIVFSRHWFTPRRQAAFLQAQTQGETLTEIPPGQAGRVLYEGNSWRAICEDEAMAIAPHQKVYVLRREGNTLIVLPQNLL